jgi:hypothetical protein
LERAKARSEIQSEIAPDLVFDIMSGVMLYTLIFQPTTEPWQVYVRRALNLVLKNAVV